MKNAFLKLALVVLMMLGAVQARAIVVSLDYFRILSTVADLQAYRPPTTNEEFWAMVVAPNDFRLYRYQPGSTATDNGDTVIQSTDEINGPDNFGRWIRIENENVADWTGSGRAAVLNKPTLSAVATSGVYGSLTGIPTSFTPATHTHPIGSITGLQTALDAKLAIPSGTANQYLRGSDGTPQSRSFSYTTRALNTCFQPNATRDVLATYSVDIAATISLVTGQTGTVFLEIYSNSSCTTGTQEITRFVNGNTGALTVGLNLTQNVTGTLTGVIPAGSYVQLRTTGTATFTARPGQETAL